MLRFEMKNQMTNVQCPRTHRQKILYSTTVQYDDLSSSHSQQASTIAYHLQSVEGIKNRVAKGNTVRSDHGNS